MNADDDPKTNWRSIWTGCVLGMISSVQFSLYFTSLYPFMRVLDPTASEFLFGIVVSAYALAQIIGSPTFGYTANRLGRNRPPLIACYSLQFAGNVIYALVELFPSGHNYWLMLARFVTGLGSSSIGLVKSYASAASTSQDRRRALAFVTGGNALGMTMGPCFQFAFIRIGYPGWRVGGASSGFNISMFTAPALFATLLNLASIAVLVFMFEESYVGVLGHVKGKGKGKNAPSDASDASSGSIAPAATPLLLPKYDRVAAQVCYAARFTQMFVFSNIETIGSSFEMMMFTLTATEVVTYSSYAHMGRGVITFSVYASYIFTKLGTRINDRLVVLGSLVALFAYHLLTFSWPFYTHHVTIINSTVLHNGSTAVGCNSDVDPWCGSLTQVNMWVYYSLIVVFVGASFANLNVTVNTIFSRVIGPRMQGTQQGVMMMHGSAARLVGPIMVGFIYSRYGPRYVWMLEFVVIAIMTVLWVWAHRRLVPLKIPPPTPISVVTFVEDIHPYEIAEFDPSTTPSSSPRESEECDGKGGGSYPA